MPGDLSKGIVRILDSDGDTAGTGFVVTADGLIATCAHVVEAAGAGPDDTVRVAFHATGEKHEAQVERAWWRASDAEDVAILRLKEPLPKWVIPLPLGSSAGVEGHTLTTFGFPDTKPLEGMAGKCEVVGRTTERGFPVLQLRSSEVTPGFSGAPVWDEGLHVVVGMVTSIAAQDQYGRQQETAFIIPVETLRAVCPALLLPKGCPYRGLQVFEAEHADLYFGREAATRELLDILSRRDFVVLVGVSGSGKSSLVRAGLEKGLHEHAIPGLINQLRCLAVPGRNSLLNLTLALADAEGITAADVAEAFDLPEDALAEGKRRQTADALNTRSPRALADAVQACVPSEGLLLIVDQFERLYTECDDEAVRDRFVDALLAAAGDRVKVLLALRADYYGLALEHPGLEQVVKQGGQVTLGRMTEANLRAAIEEPARTMGWSLQPGLAERLIVDVHERAGDLPLLEFALTELWAQDNQKGVLTLATYEALGYEAPDGRCFPGVQGAIARRADTLWQGLDDEERRAARRVFLNLVTPGPLDERGERMAEDASRRAWQAEWDETTRRAVQELVDARLLTTGQDPVSDQPTVEVAHEALIRAWPRLQQWLADYHPFVRWYGAELALYLRRWLDKDRHPDFLLPKAMLTQAEHWLRQYPDELSGPPEAYIRTSVQKREKERTAQERRRRQLTLVALGAAVVFLSLALLAWGQRNAAREAQVQAETAQLEAERLARVGRARELAAHALAEDDPTGSLNLMLAREAVLTTWLTDTKIIPRPFLTNEAFAALHYAVQKARQLPWRMTIPWRQGHTGNVNSVAYSPDGSRIVSGSDDQTVRVWDAQTGEELTRLTGHTGGVDAVAYSPDGGRIVSGSWDKTVRVWDAETGEELTRLTGFTGFVNYVNSVAFSPDGSRIASGSGDGTVRVWDAQTGEELTQLTGHTGDVNSVAYSPDGSRIVSGGYDGTVRVWDAEMGEELTQLTDHTGGVWSVAFSPDGSRIVNGSDDRTVRVWDAQTGEKLAQLTGHTSRVWSVAYSPDGSRIISGSDDGTVRVWDAQTGEELTQLTDHTWGVNSVAYSPDSAPGRGRIVSGSDDQTVRVWDAETGEELTRLTGHTDWVLSVAYSPDGSRIISGSSDGTVRVWDAETGEELTQLTGHTWGVYSVAYSPDGSRIVSGGYDQTVRVWDAETGEELTRLTGHTGGVRSVAFSPDGERIVSGSDDQTVRLWFGDIEALLNLADSLIQRDPPVFQGDERIRFGFDEQPARAH